MPSVGRAKARRWVRVPVRGRHGVPSLPLLRSRPRDLFHSLLVNVPKFKRRVIPSAAESRAESARRRWGSLVCGKPRRFDHVGSRKEPPRSLDCVPSRPAPARNSARDDTPFEFRDILLVKPRVPRNSSKIHFRHPPRERPHQRSRHLKSILSTKSRGSWEFFPRASEMICRLI